MAHYTRLSDLEYYYQGSDTSPRDDEDLFAWRVFHLEYDDYGKSLIKKWGFGADLEDTSIYYGFLDAT